MIYLLKLLTKFTNSPLVLEKQIKTIENQGKKQIDALKNSKFDAQHLTIKDEIPEDQLSEEVENEIEKVKEIEELVNW